MDFNKTHSIQIRFVTGPENILLAGVCVHFFFLEMLGAVAVKGLNSSLF